MSELLKSLAVERPVARPHLRPASFSDYDGISALDRTNGLPVRPRGEWLRLWLDNPACRHHPALPIGWVLEGNGGEIVGSLANIPFTVFRGSDQFLACSPRAWAVHPNYRAFSISLLSPFLRQPGVDLLLTTTPNPTAAALYQRFGWTPPPVGRWHQSALWLGSPSALLRSFLPFRPDPLPPRPAPPASPAPSHPGICLQWSARLDSALGPFWSDLRSAWPSLLLPDRSLDALRWRYRSALLAGRLWVLSAWRSGSIVASLFLLRRDSTRRHLTRVCILDYQALEPGPSLCRAMLSAAIRRCRRQGIAVLENPGCWLEGPSGLNSPAPFHRALPCAAYLCAVPNETLRPAAWRPTQFEGDIDL